MSTDTDKQLVIIALGNRFRGDDAVGPEVAKRLSWRHRHLPVIEGCDDSLSIINAWQDVTVALVVDAAQSGAPAGTIHTLDAVSNPLPKDLARCSSHGVGLSEALAMSRVLGRLPRHIMIYAVEGICFDTGAPLSAPVSTAVDRLIGQLESDWADELAQARFVEGVSCRMPERREC